MMKNENNNLITNSWRVLNTWKNYFKRLSNIAFENNREIDLEFYMVKIMINELTISEVKSAIKRLKNYKTPGIELIPA